MSGQWDKWTFCQTPHVQLVRANIGNLCHTRNNRTRRKGTHHQLPLGIFAPATPPLNARKYRDLPNSTDPQLVDQVGSRKAVAIGCLWSVSVASDRFEELACKDRELTLENDFLESAYSKSGMLSAKR